MTITQNEILEALRAALAQRPSVDDGVTRRELADACNAGLDKVRKWLLVEMKQGRIECIWVRRARCDGVEQQTAAYRIKP